MTERGESMENDVHGSPEGQDGGFERFENLARKVVTTPKPASAPAETVGEPSDERSERERES